MARLSVYDPFAEVFPEIFRGMLQPARPATEALEIRMDVREESQQYVVLADLPGVRKDDIQVQIDGHHVQISAEIKRETEAGKDGRLLRNERYAGMLARTFSLASEIDEAAVSARFENGVLALTLPKKQAPAARRITIQ